MHIAWDLVVNTTSAAPDIDTGRPWEGVQPRYSGLREKGTATTPSSTISIPYYRRTVTPEKKLRMVEMSGLEPPTPSLRTRCSPS